MEDNWRVQITASKIIMNAKGTTEVVTTEYFGQETFKNEYILAGKLRELQAMLRELGFNEDIKLEIRNDKVLQG